MTRQILLRYMPERPDRARVYGQHYRPETLSEEQIEEGLLVYTEDIPQPEHQPGQRAVLYCNPETGELWHEYRPIEGD